MIYERLRRAVEEGGEFEAEYRVLCPGGVVRRILSRARVLRDSRSAPDRLIGVTLDVTEARELAEERERARARELTALAEAAERERISRELHDRVAHTMGIAHQSIELHRAFAKGDPERAAEKLARAEEASKTALEQTRDLSAQLARQGTEETSDGLGAALSELLAAYVPEGVETALSVEGDQSAVPSSVADETYLVMREAVRNAVAHSECGRIEVSIEVRDGELQGRVEDDGTGFEAREGPDGPRPGRGDGAPEEGVGLGSMRERVELLGGRLSLDSEPGSGTMVEVRVPLAD
jgi:signal transduction histidine kinase